MKKIAVTLAAVAALGVAACNNSSTEAGNNATDVNATETETGNDVNGAAAIDIDANGSAAIDATGNALDSLGNTAAEGASAVGNAASDAANSVSNAAD